MHGFLVERENIKTKFIIPYCSVWTYFSFTVNKNILHTYEIKIAVELYLTSTPEQIFWKKLVVEEQGQNIFIISLESNFQT